MSLDIQSWIGLTETLGDVVPRTLVTRLATTLDREPTLPADGYAPQGIHWLCAEPQAPRHLLGRDAARGGFLPIVPNTQRMWAGSTIDFVSPIRIGRELERRSSVVAVSEKTGKSGPLLFVDVEHAIHSGGAEALRERQTIVYRVTDAAAGRKEMPAATAEPPPAPWQRQVCTDPILLFRFSAVTFNSHRIHYDRPYATDVEGYPELVVQGPLMAILILDLCSEMIGPNALKRFTFRGVSPAFCGETLSVRGQPSSGKATLEVRANGRVAMAAEALF